MKFFAPLAKTDLLIFDDWGLALLDDDQRRDLLEIMNDRYINRSTVVISHLQVENWHKMDTSGTLADAILNRFVHNAHKIKKMESPCRKKGDDQRSVDRNEILKQEEPTVSLRSDGWSVYVGTTVWFDRNH